MQQHEYDQMLAAIQDIAVMNKKYHESLVQAGYSEEEADKHTMLYIKAMFSK